MVGLMPNKIERSGRFIVLASGFAEDTDPLPIRTDARNGAAIHQEAKIIITAIEEAELVLVETN